MLVVKLGGSLYNTAELKQWLTILAKHAKQQPTIIVPGGGPFADQVRASQSIYHFNNSHAHHMAILAMAQFGILLASMQSQAKFIHYPDQNIPMSASLSIWLPNHRLLSINELNHSWDVTSDSLALWLSQQLQAEQLLIIKRIPTSSYSVTELVDTQVLDTGFSALFEESTIPVKLIPHQQYTHFNDYLSNPQIQLQ